MKWPLLLLLGCDIGVPAAKPTPPLHTYAVVSLVETAEPCIDNVLFHYTFALDEPGARLVHASGGMYASAELPRPWMNSKPVEVYYVAEVAMHAVPWPPIASRGPCALELASYWGDVKRTVPSRTLAEARQQLAAIERDGWPSR